MYVDSFWRNAKVKFLPIMVLMNLCWMLGCMVIQWHVWLSPYMTLMKNIEYFYIYNISLSMYSTMIWVQGFWWLRDFSNGNWIHESEISIRKVEMPFWELGLMLLVINWILSMWYLLEWTLLRVSTCGIRFVESC